MAPNQIQLRSERVTLDPVRALFCIEGPAATVISAEGARSSSNQPRNNGDWVSTESWELRLINLNGIVI